MIVPGCLDMVNFGSYASVPAIYREAGRTFYQWNPMVTLMRTNEEENEKLGQILAGKVNASSAPAAFVFPTRGISILDGEGQVFCSWDTDEVLFSSIEKNLKRDIPIYRVDANINDREFSRKAAGVLRDLMRQR